MTAKVKPDLDELQRVTEETLSMLRIAVESLEVAVQTHTEAAAELKEVAMELRDVAERKKEGN